MITAVWSVKGGVGVTTMAALLALSRHDYGEDVVIVDLEGDVDAVLGVDLPAGDGDSTAQPGVAEWLDLHRSDAEALTRLEVDVRAGLSLIPRGAAPLSPDATHLVDVLHRFGRDVIIDCGVPSFGNGLHQALIESVDRSLLVVRECFLTLRALQRCEFTPDGVIVIKEPGRELGRPDVELVAGAPVVAEVAWDSSVFRAVDAGVAQSRLPRGLVRSLERVVRSVA